MITEVSPKSSTKGNANRKAAVHIVDDRWLVFEPTTNIKHTGLIIYPGGRLDPRSYAPTAKQLSSAR